MADLKKATQFFTTAVKDVNINSIKTAAKNLPANGGIDLSKITIPMVTNDKTAQKFIEENELYKLDKLISFYVMAHFAQFASVYEGFSDLKELDLGNAVSKIDAAKNYYQQGMDNPDEKKGDLNTAAHDLGEAFSVLKGKVNFYINGIRNVDSARSKNRFMGFLKSHGDLSKVDSNNHCAKAAVNAIMEAINLQILISAELGTNIKNSVLRPFEEFKASLLSGDTCKLMHDYDDEPESEFWLKLPNRIDNAIDTADMLNEMLENRDNEDFDFDNIEFN